MGPSTMLHVDGSASQPSKLWPPKILTQPGYGSDWRPGSAGVPASARPPSSAAWAHGIAPHANTNTNNVDVFILLFVIKTSFLMAVGGSPGRPRWGRR